MKDLYVTVRVKYAVICRKFWFQTKGEVGLYRCILLRIWKRERQAKEKDSSYNINFLSKFAILTQTNQMKIADFCLSKGNLCFIQCLEWGQYRMLTCPSLSSSPRNFSASSSKLGFLNKIIFDKHNLILKFWLKNKQKLGRKSKIYISFQVIELERTKLAWSSVNMILLKLCALDNAGRTQGGGGLKGGWPTPSH